MSEIAVWIEHLRHPLVLVGFGLFIFGLIIKPLFLRNEKLSGKAIERLLHKGMILLFILAFVAIAGGLALSWKEKSQVIALAHVEQKTEGEKSPAINSGGDVQINYGNIPSNSEKAEKKASATEEQAVSTQVTQSTQGEKSPAINSQGNVEINYAD